MTWTVITWSISTRYFVATIPKRKLYTNTAHKLLSTPTWCRHGQRCISLGTDLYETCWSPFLAGKQLTVPVQKYPHTQTDPER